MFKKQKGYALLITMIITFVLIATSITLLTVVYRYSNVVRKRQEELQENILNNKENLSVIDYDYFI